MNLFSDLEKFSSNTCVVDQNYKKFSYLDLLKLSDFSTSKIKKGSVVFLLCEIKVRCRMWHSHTLKPLGLQVLHRQSI